VNLKITLCFLGLAAALCFSRTVCAQTAEPPEDLSAPPAKPGVSSPDTDAVDRLTLAAQLAAVGRDTGSPLALAAAAELYAASSVKDKDQEKAVEGGEAPVPGAKPSALPTTDSKTLFAEAVAAAREASNEPLALEIEKAASNAGTRQPVPGAGGRHRDEVNPYATDVYSVRYRGGEPARATVIADGTFDIDLYVYSSSGNLVDYDNDATSIGICSWTPSQTRDYTLRVKNTTGSYVSYLIYTN
jgi:hypothetical protein